MRLWALQGLVLLSCACAAPFRMPLRESRAKCFFQARAHCHYAGEEYTLGESWVSTDCMLCTCLHPIGVGCCEILQHPIDFPDWCEAHYDAQTCQISVVQKEDHSLPCMSSMDQESGSDDGSENTLDNVFKSRFMS